MGDLSASFPLLCPMVGRVLFALFCLFGSQYTPPCFSYTLSTFSAAFFFLSPQWKLLVGGSRLFNYLHFGSCVLVWLDEGCTFHLLSSQGPGFGFFYAPSRAHYAWRERLHGDPIPACSIWLPTFPLLVFSFQLGHAVIRGITPPGIPRQYPYWISWSGRATMA